MFYDAFLELCNEVGKSPTAIGELLGISKGTISTWKSGKSKPTDKMIKKIAVFFDVDFESLKEGQIRQKLAVKFDDGSILEAPIANEEDIKKNKARIEEMKTNSDESNIIKQTVEFSTKYSLLTEVQKKLVSDLIDTFLSGSK